MDDRPEPSDIRPPAEADCGDSDPMPSSQAIGTDRPAIPVAGIGASAGGLEVFKRLLAELPADTGIAIVFIQHLDSKHPSMLAEILGRATPMAVTEAADGMAVEANHVYVLPENADLTIARGVLGLALRTEPPGTHMPIDRFFRSLAEDCGSKAIGVILSGTGTDGSAGVQAIKAAGGVTFAQDQSTAKFPTMPQAAVDTGCVDFVLPPERIVAELVRIGQHPYVADPVSAGEDRAQADEDDAFGSILAALHGAAGIDFSLYREKTIKRRIMRRLALRNIDSVAEYAARLYDDPNELNALQRDLLIGVTNFFRDPDSFESLKRLAFPRILEGRPANSAIRVWVAGCATGEEAYSIAIALQEHLTATGASFPVQIFASDLSPQAIEKARAGKYFENIAADIGHVRLNRFFTKLDNGYLVNKNLREMCVFTRHNLMDDPPFSKLDLISCRNVLIYLGTVQKDIIPLFHYALRANGFLMLGASETAAADELFSLVSRKDRIYAKRETGRKPHSFPMGAKASRQVAEAGGAAVTGASRLWNGVEVSREVDRILLSRYGPAGVVVDDDLEVIEIRGKAGPYLQLPAGKVSFNLLKLIPDAGLFLEVEKLIQHARQTGEAARQDSIRFEADGSEGIVNVEVLPLHAKQSRSILILFEPPQAVSERRNEALGEPTQDTGQTDRRDFQIASLKRQLSDAKERLVTLLEEHQTYKEESQNTTEEVLSASEELQSLNEELETTKEELQSTNEELITLNEEMKSKNTALLQARDFAMSIVETVSQPLLVLDEELRIKMANQAFYQAFQLSPLEAEGRLIYSLSQGRWDLPGLRESLNRLARGGVSFPGLETERDFPVLGHRFLVVGGRRIEDLRLILLAIDDVTESKLAEKALRKGEEHLRQAQKMEAIGRLAGGIAHDFNNLLTAIIGYSGLLHDTVAGNEQALQQVNEIKAAGERAASLTQQLLAFSRRQVLHPKVLNLNLIVADLDRMLRRLVGERINVAIDCAPALWNVKADAGEIGRAIINLTLNARDAMPGGGTLTIGTANVTLSEADAAKYDHAPGRYVVLTVGDTGVGMDTAMRAQIFEPFFTTKETGKGTGLGLATVLGIVEQSGGRIHCESELGLGTIFRIFLPEVAESLDKEAKPVGGLDAAPKGSEVVLLVEDEETVRVLARRILEMSGYVVLEAGDGREGLAVCEAHQGMIDLLVTDVVMPKCGGRELAEAALKRRPGLKILFMSGHTQDVTLKAGVERGSFFLQKPFSPIDLARRVREALDSDVGLAGQAESAK